MDGADLNVDLIVALFIHFGKLPCQILFALQDQRLQEARNKLDERFRAEQKQQQEQTFVDPQIPERIPPASETCIICMSTERLVSPDDAVRTFCLHGKIFHKKCLEQWKKERTTCPTCRLPLDVKQCFLKMVRAGDIKVLQQAMDHWEQFPETSLLDLFLHKSGLGHDDEARMSYKLFY